MLGIVFPNWFAMVVLCLLKFKYVACTEWKWPSMTRTSGHFDSGLAMGLGTTSDHLMGARIEREPSCLTCASPGSSRSLA